ncbi:substrate-binding periplasmic protein [Curvivirga sp.]|uniref:substrate-binding periplasmic protein n=1 Tax=Curvivirga sp. TaxID=2856848 RepID=UPI003B5A45BD
MRRRLANLGKCISLLFSLQFLWIESAYSAEPLEIATIGNFPPYTYLIDEQLTGIDIDILDELSRRSGVKFTYVTLPWKRALKKTEIGEVDGMFSLFHNQKRASYAHFIEPAIHYSTYKLFVRTGEEFIYQDVSDLYGKSVVLNLGYYINSPLERAIKAGKVKVLRIPYTGEALAVLANRKVDVLIGNYHEILFNKGLNPDLDHIVDLPNPIQMPKEAYLVISKKAEIPDKKRVMEELSQHLLTIHQDGTVNRIYQKHHPATLRQNGVQYLE